MEGFTLLSVSGSLSASMPQHVAALAGGFGSSLAILCLPRRNDAFWGDVVGQGGQMAIALQLGPPEGLAGTATDAARLPCAGRDRFPGAGVAKERVLEPGGSPAATAATWGRQAGRDPTLRPETCTRSVLTLNTSVLPPPSAKHS